MRVRSSKSLHVIPMAAAFLAWGTISASAQAITKQGFNFNPAPCPTAPAQYSALRAIGIDKFTDGTPLPSCGGMFNGRPFKMVWTGARSQPPWQAWAVFGGLPAAAPSLPRVNIQPIQRPAVPAGIRFAPNQLNLAPSGTLRSTGQTVYRINGSWYLITNDGGTLMGRLVAAGAGNLAPGNVVRIVSTNGGTDNIMLNAGANLR